MLKITKTWNQVGRRLRETVNQRKYTQGKNLGGSRSGVWSTISLMKSSKSLNETARKRNGTAWNVGWLKEKTVYSIIVLL